jgi:hypothetical protein
MRDMAEGIELRIVVGKYGYVKLLRKARTYCTAAS